VPRLTDPTVHLRLVGLLLVADGVAHLALPWALGWPASLARLPLLTRQVIYVHTYFVGLACVLFGLLAALAGAELLAGGALARAVLAAAVAFWGSRLAAQLFVFDASLWRGRRATVLGHLALVTMWTYVTAAFAWPLLRGR
jgi:hypothetical protein